MKNLPTIYKQEGKMKNHNKKYCYVVDHKGIEEEIKRIEESLGPLSRKEVYIETIEKAYRTFLYKIEENTLITMNNEIIPKDSIIKIKRIS